jgi:hypothetical protein
MHAFRTAAPFALALAGCAAPAPIDVPPALDPGAGQRLLTTLAAQGVQIYECRSAAGAAPAWAFVAPQATLADERGRAAGTHGAGPHWTATDGSRVEGRVQARADAPRPDAIPWLLLATHSTGGAGAFSGVTRIQRVRTEGGLAPAAGCSASSLGHQVRVPYRADYRLFGRA